MKDHQKENFRRLFGINEHTKNNEKQSGVLLKKVLQYGSIEEDNISLPFEDFKDFFYCKNEEWKIKDNEMKKLEYNICSNAHKFHYIHGHGKNGKTTFVKNFKNKYKDQFNVFEINFKSLGNIPDTTYGLKHKLIELFKSLSLEQKNNLNKALYQISGHFDDDTIENPEDNEMIKDYNLIFDNVIDKIADFLKQITDDFRLKKITKMDREFRKEFQKFCDDNQKTIRTEQLFILYLLSAVKLKGTTNKKTVFVFDNIDDILTHASDYFSSKIISRTYYYFCEVFIRYLNREKIFITPNILENIHFIFVYRTANYVSAMHSLTPNPSVQDRIERELIDAPKYVINSKELSLSILLKKIEFYEKLCLNFDIQKNERSDIFKEVIKSFKDELENLEEKSISRLWNGNNIAFSNCLVAILSALSDNELKVLANKNTNYSIKRGILFYYITKYYSNLNQETANSPLFAGFRYVWDVNANEGKCNLLRLFLSYIINSEGYENIKNNSDLYGNGVGLYDILNAFSLLGYHEKDFESLLEIFNFDIDTFDYFISCFKQVNLEVGTNNEKLGKRYDFLKEFTLFFSKKELTRDDIANLNHIRLYANPNALFFLDIIKKHFEFMSFFSGSLHPLLSLMQINKISSKERITFTNYKTIIEFNNTKPFKAESIEIEGIYKNIQEEKELLKYDKLICLNNEEYLSKTYLKIEELTKHTVLYFLKTFSLKYTPKQYCEATKFTLNKRFLYADIISKHINYIENVRYEIIQKRISFEKSSNCDSLQEIDIMKNINMIFIYWIEKNINLFFILYALIDNNIPKESMDEHSVSVYHSFERLSAIIDDIKKKDFLDFDTKINTKYIKI